MSDHTSPHDWVYLPELESSQESRECGRCGLLQSREATVYLGDGSMVPATEWKDESSAATPARRSFVPSPAEPCFCVCHRSIVRPLVGPRNAECFDCKQGRHIPRRASRV